MEFWSGKGKRGQIRTLNAIFVQLLHHIFTPNSCQTHIRELLCIPIVQVIFKKKESQFKDTIINQFKLAMGVLCERSPLSHYEARNLCLSVCMSVCYSHISRAVHQINFTLVCGCPAGDTRNCCGSDNGAIWTCSNTFRMNTFLINSVQQWGGHGFGDWASWLCRLRLGSHAITGYFYFSWLGSDWEVRTPHVKFGSTSHVLSVIEVTSNWKTKAVENYLKYKCSQV